LTTTVKYIKYFLKGMYILGTVSRLCNKKLDLEHGKVMTNILPVEGAVGKFKEITGLVL